RAVDPVVGRGLRAASHDGHRGVCRDVRRHGVRPLPDAALLRARAGHRRVGLAKDDARGACRPAAVGCGYPGGRMMLPRLIAAIAGMLVLVGCASRVPYTAPEPAPYRAPSVDGVALAGDDFDTTWWRQFEDPVLDELVEQAIAANHDIRLGMARVAQARAVFDD